MKLVINASWGGFSLSEEALYKLYEKRGIKIYKIRDAILDAYTTVPYEEYKKIHAADEANGDYTLTNEVFINDRNVKRDDLDLIAVVEELGTEKASGEYAELEVLEIPDGIEYEIHEYDGLESIHECHRSWP